MMPYVSRIDRRTALRWITAATATLAVAPKAVRAATYVKTPQGYGTDPDLMNPTAPWARIMTDRQLQLSAVLADIILPEEPPHPSPSMIGVPDFINEWVSSPYERTQKDKQVILAGLDRLDRAAKARSGQGFAECGDADRLALVEAIARPGEGEDADFFRRFRTLTLGGYYTTPEGFEDIGYVGNVPMERYPGPTDDMKAMLEARLKAIGI
jgi:hypothetical protein